MSIKAHITPMRILMGVGGLFLVVLMLTALLVPKSSNIAKTANSSSTASLQAASDNPAEFAQNITGQLNQLNSNNKALLAQNKDLMKKNQQLVQSMQDNFATKLAAMKAAQGQASQTQIEQLQAQVSALQDREQGAQQAQDRYQVDQQATKPVHTISWVSDMSDSLPKEQTQLIQSAQTQNASNWKAQAQKVLQKPKKDKAIPFYTIPANATAIDATTMSALIGRVPIDGQVRNPYRFKVIIGAKNLAANGIYIPNLKGIVASGVATGDMLLSCVRGTLDSLTFVFQDGRISTSRSKSDSSTGLGWISQQNGNPCITGHFYTNAPEYLGIKTGLIAGAAYANAYADAQTTTTQNAIGGQSTFISGNASKYALGQAGSKGFDGVSKWVDQRARNSFDAVYVPGGMNIAVNFEQAIDIDYDKQGRKVAYEHESSPYIVTHLD